MGLRAHEFETLCEAAREGPVDFDGLHLDDRTDGYELETPTETRTGLSVDELQKALGTYDEHVSNWYYWEELVGGHSTARRAFLRWCERAPVSRQPTDGTPTSVAPAEGSDQDFLNVSQRYDALSTGGIERQWGELTITVQLPDTDGDYRTYRLNHVDDTGEIDDFAVPTDVSGGETDRPAIEIYQNPRNARGLTTYDENGRYRPLKTAPSLVSGWVFPDLSGNELVEAVKHIYPATIANWHREQQNELDIDHWIDTAERQTGIYDVIDELPRAALEWVTEACCVDSQCLKRREWEYAEEDEIDVEAGTGQFPCREPCSLVIAAARTWTILESESERTWEIELTTSEKNQLDAMIDAVADGRIDEIREADLTDGANRYRARYLRAKRFEDGSLPFVEASSDDSTD